MGQGLLPPRPTTRITSEVKLARMVTRIGPKKLKPRRIFLREWREHRGLTQQQLADRIESTNATVSRVENLKRDVTLRFLEAAAVALDCTPAQIISEQPPAPSKPLEDTEIVVQIERLLRKRG